MDENEIKEMEAKLADRRDLLDRFNSGDSRALLEIVEQATDATIGEVTVRIVA